MGKSRILPGTVKDLFGITVELVLSFFLKKNQHFYMFKCHLLQCLNSNHTLSRINGDIEEGLSLVGGRILDFLSFQSRNFQPYLLKSTLHQRFKIVCITNTMTILLVQLFGIMLGGNLVCSKWDGLKVRSDIFKDMPRKENDAVEQGFV